MEHWDRNLLVSEILLDLNLAPNDLNCLILDYQKPAFGEFINQIKLSQSVNDIAVNHKNIYISTNDEIIIYNKKDLSRINKWKLTKERLYCLPKKGTYSINNITVDEDYIYILLYSSGCDTSDNYGIILAFDDDGNIIKKFGKREITDYTAITIDNNYIYVIDYNFNLKKICKKTLKSTDYKIPFDVDYIIESFVVIDERYIYAVVLYHEAIIVFDLDNGKIKESKYIADEDGYSIIAKNDDMIYFYNRPDLTIYSERKAGEFELNKISQLKRKNIEYTSMAVDDQYLYYVNDKKNIVEIYGK